MAAGKRYWKILHIMGTCADCIAFFKSLLVLALLIELLSGSDPFFKLLILLSQLVK